MKTLSIGARGPQVQLLQLALQRAGYDPGGTDGVFGPRTQAALQRFQRDYGLVPDGIAGPLTHAALRPYYTGYTVHTVRAGDTLFRIAERYGTTLGALYAANPGADPQNLRIGQRLTVPLGFDVVPTTIAYCSELVFFCCEGLAARYPFISFTAIGQSIMGRPLHLLRLGRGGNRVFHNACHHANEWITTPLLLKFTEQLAAAYAFNAPLGTLPSPQSWEGTELAVAPCVNPDGLDLVTGDLTGGAYYARAVEIAEAFPAIPFPNGWKANIRGVDLNLQYPAEWLRAREIKFAQGFTAPAPRDYVGIGPLVAPESLAVYDFTLNYSPALTLSYHTQGNVIYWKFLDFEPEGSRAIAYRFAAQSGYLVEETPYASGFAGYKDWFIQDFDRPGYTIEAGLGENPLPLSQFDRIYADNLGILTESLTVTR